MIGDRVIGDRVIKGVTGCVTDRVMDHVLGVISVIGDCATRACVANLRVIGVIGAVWLLGGSPVVAGWWLGGPPVVAGCWVVAGYRVVARFLGGCRVVAGWLPGGFSVVYL